MSDGAEQLAFRARALAQSHPLSALAKRYVDAKVAEQRLSQPLPEIGIWAGMALTHGYCVRRVEEIDAGIETEHDVPSELELGPLDEESDRIAAALRTGGACPFLVEEADVVAALDRIVFSEVERRLDHWRDDIDEHAWTELEEYIAFWVVKGYALRAAERSTGALA